MNLTPRQIVKQINDHCDKGNGIYVQWPQDGRQFGRSTQRCFRAKLIDCSDLGIPPAAFVTPDFGHTWLLVEDGTTFTDGNWNRPIGNLPVKGKDLEKA